MANLAKRSKYNKVNEESEKNINPKNLELLERYKVDMELRGLSEKSRYNYSRDIIQWFVYLVENQFNPSIVDLTDDDIEEFIYHCKKNGNNVERIKGRLSAISAFYTYLRRKKICRDNPCEFIPRPKKGLPVVIQTFLTPEQYTYMKRVLKSNGDLQLETYALLSISTMGRVNAVSNITWEQIDFENRIIDDVLEKEGYITTLYYDEEVKELLIKLKEQRDNDGVKSNHVFLTRFNEKASVETLNNWTKKIGEMIGVPSLHPHDFRHSGSQLMSLNGAPIELISELLNHKGLDVTKNHYLKQDKKAMQKKKDNFKI